MFPLTPDQHHWLEVATEDEGWCSFTSCTPSRSRARTVSIHMTMHIMNSTHTQLHVNSCYYITSLSLQEHCAAADTPEHNIQQNWCYDSYNLKQFLQNSTCRTVTYLYLIIIIITIIRMTMFMVLSSWLSHCESSQGSSDVRRPGQLTWAVSPPVGCYMAYIHHRHFIITQLESWYSFYRPREGGWKAEST